VKMEKYISQRRLAWEKRPTPSRRELIYNTWRPERETKPFRSPTRMVSRYTTSTGGSLPTTLYQSRRPGRAVTGFIMGNSRANSSDGKIPAIARRSKPRKLSSGGATIALDKEHPFHLKARKAIMNGMLSRGMTAWFVARCWLDAWKMDALRTGKRK